MTSAGRRTAALLATAVIALLASPSTAHAHALHGRVDSPLPFAAYVIGAAAAVALSFAFLARGDTGPTDRPPPGRTRRLPAWWRASLRAVGLAAWVWVVAQTIVGGTSDAEVASLVLWVFGWVGVAMISALVGPVWPWLDPFTTLHDLAAWATRRIGLGESGARPLPTRLGTWPAVALMGFFVWLELAVRVDGGRPLGAVLVGYTLLTLAGMAIVGAEAWRTRVEVFSVWFGLLGRLAPFGLVGEPRDGLVRRRPFGSALVHGPWSGALVALAAVATGAVIYDGLSQTEPFYSVFGIPTPAAETLILAAFLALIVTVVLAVGRRVGIAAMGAGLVPVAVGYLVAHYLTLLLVEGQRILVALSDPLQLGWDLWGTAFWEPREDWLPTAVVWSLQVGAVLVGHVVGAWLGHAAVARERRAGAGVAAWPLAAVMVGLTALTLWSLGQNLVFESGASGTPVPATSSSHATR